VTRSDSDEEREERIQMEIIVDAYTQDEQAMGWQIYLVYRSEFAVERI